MFPPRFRYEAPRSLAEAVSLLHEGQGEAKVLAGGQSLVPLMKLRFASPELLVDINNLPDLDHHRVDDSGALHVGALCRHVDIERSGVVAERQPTMAAAAPLIADPIVRTRGTLVGSLCHADPQGDWASVMTALGGHVVARGPGGQRTIAISDFVTGPFQNTLAYDEIAVEAVVPGPRGRLEGGFLKLERRVGDFATAGAAVSVELDGDRIVRAGIGLSGVGARTIDAREAADSLVGGVLDEAAITRAADLAASAAEPRSDHRGSAEYKRHVVHTFVTRILTRVSTTATKAA
ncbi:MAG TPA: xanthine dehydrogenase family protein subunit M [Nocardioides sp.]|nr:xanthine dehydrogenase family protein subunit M [Nocardioides sp.]